MSIKKILRDSFISRLIPDKLYLSILYRNSFGYFMDFKNPKTFNEKLQWLKLYDRKEIYSKMVDKYEVKKYISDIIGEEYIIPTIGVYDKFDDIDFDTLPNQFVIKCTHDSGGIVICKDKKEFDIIKAKTKINKCLKHNFYYQYREWPYKNVQPRIIIEKYVEDKEKKALDDYKFFCFNGEPKVMFIATERQNENNDTCFDFFDMDFNHLNIRNGHPNAVNPPSMPKNFKKMKELAKTLSKGMPHVRIDFYEINGKVYFGEITFFHWGGFVKFVPQEWDEKLGDLLELPTKNNDRGD